jgi:sugar lactone lactonase YvrE
LTQLTKGEGIDVLANQLFFVSKVRKRLYILNLDDLTYTSSTTQRGLFDGQPDQLQRFIGTDGDELLYFTEDGGSEAGIHCRNDLGQFVTILESPVYPGDETTGLAFSPDGKHMYLSYQDAGLLFDITRTDGLPFQAITLNVKFHALGDD